LSYDPSWRFPRRWFQVRKLDSVELTWKPPPSSSNYAWDIAQKQALKANLAVMKCIDGQVDQLECSILAKVKLGEDYKALRTVRGIGQILAVTIALETGDIGRFAGPGNFRVLRPHGGQPARIKR
jgi:hypothetical protein